MHNYAYYPIYLWIHDSLHAFQAKVWCMFKLEGKVFLRVIKLMELTDQPIKCSLSPTKYQKDPKFHNRLKSRDQSLSWPIIGQQNVGLRWMWNIFWTLAANWLPLKMARATTFCIGLLNITQNSTMSGGTLVNICLFRTKVHVSILFENTISYCYLVLNVLGSVCLCH